MRRSSLAPLVALFAWSLASPAAHAAMPSPVPVTFRSLTTTVSPGDDVDPTFNRLTYGCYTRTLDQPIVLFMAGSVTAPDGTVTGSSLEGMYFTQGMALATRVGADRRMILDYPRTDVLHGYDQGTIPLTDAVAVAGSTLRIAWASWGTNFDCQFTINGVVLASSPGDPSHAGFATPADFDGGADVAGALVDTAIQASARRSSAGYLFALLFVDFGQIRADGPAGEHLVATSTPTQASAIGIDQATSGTWTYGIDVGVKAGSDGGPVLWTIEVPA